MKKIKKIIIVGEFRFPSGDAASVRVLGIAKILRSCGYSVTLVGKSWEKDEILFSKGTFDGFYYHNVVVKNQAFLNRFSTLFYSGVLATEIIVKEDLEADLIIYYGSSARYLCPLRKLASKRDIKLVVDLVEWYEPSHLLGGRYGPIALDVTLGLRYFIPKCDGLIAISSLLETHYLAKKMLVVKIPQIVDVQEQKWSPTDYESFSPQSLNLVYAGIPGQKDLLSIAILGIKYLSKNNFNVKLHLFGPSKTDIEVLMKDEKGNVGDLHQNLVYHGRINQSDLPKYIVRGDYSILLRPNKRYANAGFATKFVESFAVGLPVIANITSDMGLYLKDSKNGFIVNECTVDAFVKTVLTASQLSENDVSQMRMEAKKTGTEFDYRNFTVKIQDFVTKVENVKK